jgi:phosphomannomutase
MPTLLETLTYQPVELAFGTSGLRGLVTDMTDLECYINATGFLRFMAQAEGLAPASTVYLAGDLRDSTPRILKVMAKAITDSGHQVVYSGLVPTPTVAYYALTKLSACIMVTGSHIPDDRNGIKFYKADGEVLKDDELSIKEAVAEVRAELYALEAEKSEFSANGSLKHHVTLPPEDATAAHDYKLRFRDIFDSDALAGKKVVLYQHSSVGRDMYVEMLQAMGATVETVGRSDKFVPIDTENVTPDDQAYFKVLAKQHPDAFAIVSADGDADRPFVIDETGVFHRGDVLGAVVADWLDADFAGYPVSASDAVDKHLTDRNIHWQHTKIGSPYVVSVMYNALRAGSKRVVGWEVNGGFLIGGDLQVNGKTLKALPTRDAFLPIAAALVTAVQSGKPISGIFDELSQRFTQAGLINDFPTEVSKQIIQRYSEDTPEARAALGQHFSAAHGFGNITKINSLDGVRMYFDNGDIAHMRPSGNAPQLRIYSVANTQERADEIVAKAIAEPNGIFRAIEADLQR